MQFKKLIDTEIEVINKMCADFLHCSLCFLPKTIIMKQKMTLFSFFGLTSRRAVFYCKDCQKVVKALQKDEIRDFKLNI